MDDEYGLDSSGNVEDNRHARFDKANTPGGEFWATSAASLAIRSSDPLPDLLGNASDSCVPRAMEQPEGAADPSMNQSPLFSSDAFLEEEDDLFNLLKK